MGPPGSRRKEHALAMGDVFNMDCVSVGDLLNKEISKKSEYGKTIVDQRRTYSYVPDNIVIDLVKKQIETLEAEQKSWIIEGFPRTRVSVVTHLVVPSAQPFTNGNHPRQVHTTRCGGRADV